MYKVGYKYDAHLACASPRNRTLRTPSQLEKLQESDVLHCNIGLALQKLVCAILARDANQLICLGNRNRCWIVDDIMTLVDVMINIVSSTKSAYPADTVNGRYYTLLLIP